MGGVRGERGGEEGRGRVSDSHAVCGVYVWFGCDHLRRAHSWRRRPEGLLQHERPAPNLFQHACSPGSVPYV